MSGFDWLTRDKWLLHAADYAALIGVRRTRCGRWVFQGRTYRTRALAMRRAPRSVSVDCTNIDAVLDADGVVKPGVAFVVKGMSQRDMFLSWAPSVEPWPASFLA